MILFYFLIKMFSSELLWYVETKIMFNVQEVNVDSAIDVNQFQVLSLSSYPNRNLTKGNY